MENLYKYIDERLEKKKGISRTWIDGLADLFSNNGYSENEIFPIFEDVLSDESLDFIDSRKNGEFGDIKTAKNFWEYMQGNQEKITHEYLENAIEFMNSRKAIDGSALISFLRYVVITNYSDIQYYSKFNANEKEKWGIVACRLGNFNLCAMEVGQFGNGIIFESVFTNKGLLNLGLGAKMFTEFFKEVSEKYPDKDVYANSVMKKNIGAIRFYHRLGGKFYNQNGEKIENLMDIDYSSREYMKVVYPHEKLKELSEGAYHIPSIRQELSCDNDKNIYPDGNVIDTLENYIQRLTDMEKNYEHTSQQMPEKYALPGSIFLSKTNLEQIVADDRVIIGENDKKNSFQVCVLKENGSNIFMDIERYSYERYKLLGIQKRTKEGEVIFEWDSSKIHNQDRKLTISRKEDKLEDITDMDR